jgi:hypothetical protein
VFIKQYTIKLIVFILILFCLDRFFYFIASAGFQRTTTGETGGKVNGIRRAKSEVVILGSSRALCHYDPLVFKKELHKTVFNGGINGQDIPYIRGVVDLILRDYKPRLFIINIDATSISVNRQDFDRVTILAPFIGESNAIRTMIYHRGIFEPVKYLSLSYRYNGKPLSILKNIFSHEISGDGFEPLTGQLRSLNQPQATDTIDFDPYKLELLREAINISKKAGVRVVMANSPRWNQNYKIASNQRPLFPVLDTIAAEESIPYLSITIENTPVFHDTALFKDVAHLNKQGAEIFSSIVAAWIAKNGYD